MTEWRLSAPGGFGRRTSSPTRGTLPTSSKGTCHLCPRPSSNVTQLSGTVGAVVDDFFGTAFTHSAGHRNLPRLCRFLSAFIMARRTGIEPASPEGETPSALPAKLTARVERSDEFLVSTTATTLDAPGASSGGCD